MTRESRRLQVWAKRDDPADTHDLRKSMSTDLDLIGVQATLRSIILGHQIAGSLEGSAAITHTSYTLKNPHVNRVVAAADLINDYFIEHAIPEGDPPLSTLLFQDELSGNYMTGDEAAELLGMGGENLIANYIRKGRLTAKKERHPNKNTPQWWVLRSDVEQLVEVRNSRVTLAEATRRTGFSDTALWRIANANHLTIRHDRDGDKPVAFFDLADWERFLDMLGLNEQFLADHVQFGEAAELLRCKPDTLRRWIDQGHVVEATPPLPGFNRSTVRWFSRESIEHAKTEGYIGYRGVGRKRTHGVRQREIRESEHYTLQEAAKVCGLSSAHVRTLANKGVLEKVPGTGGKGTGVRTLVTKHSVDAYARANRAEANKRQ